MKSIPVAFLPHLILFGPMRSYQNKLKELIGWRQQRQRDAHTTIGPGYLKA